MLPLPPLFILKEHIESGHQQLKEKIKNERNDGKNRHLKKIRLLLQDNEKQNIFFNILIFFSLMYL